MADFATDGNYPAGSDDWSGQPRIVTLTNSEREAGFTPNEPVPPEVLNALFNELDVALRPCVARYNMIAGTYIANAPIGLTPAVVGYFEEGIQAISGGVDIEILYDGYYAISAQAYIKHASGSTDFCAGLKLLENTVADRVLDVTGQRWSGTAGQGFYAHGSAIYYLTAGQTLRFEGGSGTTSIDTDSAIEIIEGRVSIHRISARVP